MAQNAIITMAPTMLCPFNMCTTVVQTAAVAITKGHSINVAISFETATNAVYIPSHFCVCYLLCIQATVMPAVEAHGLSKLCIQVLKKMKTEDFFSNFGN